VGSATISANGSTNGIVWVVVIKGTATSLYAVDPVSLTHLYSSQQHQTRDNLGIVARFVTPTVANGKVYVGGRSPTGGELMVYGLLSIKGKRKP
jgi:outer membrane protein assembly factor BamB